ncbi:hypothetical protein ACLI4U_19020 (plasmid) [Natrialbaceae archaeon A-CW2]
MSSDAQNTAIEGPPEILSYHDHRTDEELSNRRAAIRERVKRAIDESHEAQSRGDYDTLATILADVLEPALNIDAWNLQRYHQQLAFGPYGWDMVALRSFLSNPDWYRTPPSEDDNSAVARARGQETPTETRRRTLDAAFESLESAAIVEGFLPSKLERQQPVFGYDMQLGERYVRADSSASGDLTIRDGDDELKTILCAGSKGSGKSTAVESLVLDSYANGHKIVDLVDFFKSENATYDIPQQAPTNADLIEAREQMGLVAGFADDEQPELEVMAPLSPGLESMRVPYDDESDTPVMKPFTIPASELTFRQLVMLLHNTTPTQENHLRSAHQKLVNSDRDWNLRDVADTVRNKTGAGDSVCDRIETALETAQGKSFIRDKECDHQLDWSDVMQDEEVITSFTVHTIREPSDRLLVLSYLLDSLYDARESLMRHQLLSEVAPLTVVMREMHKVAPRNKSEQDAESTIEGYMIDTLSELFALARHANTEIIADTQEFKQQLSREVSGLFDHIYAFRSHVPDVKQIFKTRLDETDPAETVAQFERPGKCALVNEDGYTMPIQFAPPPCHHLEAKEDGSGLGMRARVDGTGESLQYAPWNANVPARLKFQRMPDDPVVEFCEKYITQTNDTRDYAIKEFVTDTYNEWAKVQGKKIMSHNKIHRKVKGHFGLGDDTDAQITVEGERKTAHRTLVLRGEEVPI